MALCVLLITAGVSAAAPLDAGTASPAARVSPEASSTLENDTEAEPPRFDSYWYGLFGYGTIAGESYGGALALGRRIERSSVGIDLQLFAGQRTSFGTSTDASAYSVTLMKLEGLYFVRPRSRTTLYAGAGAAWSRVSLSDTFDNWRGSGIAGAVAVGYEFARADTSTRLFVQVDIAQPFFRVKPGVLNASRAAADRDARSLVVSIGAGW